MPKSKQPSPKTVKPKEWTLMFFFASDNPLAPGILSQLKSIQQAGFHLDVNVVAQYDPHTERAPIHVFDVNKVDKLNARKNKLRHKIGFQPDDTFVTNLVLDKLWIEKENIEMVKTALGASGVDYKQPPPPDARRNRANGNGEPGPKESLKNFLESCRKHYPAKRYMLFILGHGLVVGNDMFLFDENAAQNSLSLCELGDLLGRFKGRVKEAGQEFEFVSFHSCSMSALEAAYQLQGTANYMLASQGPAFVGSWPYRQMLMRIFQDVVDKEKDVKNTLKKLFSYCLFNSRDFQLAGYSFDLCLCDLNKVTDIKEPLRKLSAALTAKVSDRSVQACILLAHWDAQSYWGESYTDLYDFCLRLTQRCNDAMGASEKTDAKLLSIKDACSEVMKVLEPGAENLVISSAFAGPDYQYSHGFSVFFPWSEPATGKFWPREYKGYKFNSRSEGTNWIKFLLRYFKETMRDPRGSESLANGKSARRPRTDERLLDRMALRGFSGDGQLGDPVTVGKGGGSDVTGIGKGGGSDVTGSKGGGSDVTGCAGLSIKNYPPNTLAPIETTEAGKAARRAKW